jgi:radical SAM family uncharacterized protein/radical SAM-linked protein
MVQDILSRVEKPSRYLGTETNSIHKAPGTVKLKVALAFPDVYEIGTSHFGLQILYSILNQNETIVAERVFAPARDMEALLRDQGMPMTSLESGRPLAAFDIIGFSLLYELNYTNVLNMLDLAGIALRTEQRKNSRLLVIAGGPCVCNPEPMAPFFDAMLFGDGENAIIEMTATWLRWKASDGTDKGALLKQWACIEGVYVPQFYRAKYDHQGFQTLEPVGPGPREIRRTIVPDLEKAVFPEKPVVPFGRPIHDRLRLEVSRGCSRGCRFCQAGMIYRPVRERSCEKLLSIAQRSLEATGYDDLSLLSLSTGDYTCLAELMERLMVRCKTERVAVSLPSIRAGSLTPALMGLIQKVRKTGFTIAPEAGSQRLRDVINKNISYEDVASTVRDAFALGWQVIKLYFMIGLPTETEEDVDAIAEMVKQLKSIKGPTRRRGQINVSITTFIPKPHTPFQWAAQIDMEASRSKIERIKSQLRIPGVQVKWQNPAMSMLEGVMARGDRRLADVVERAWKRGALFDGWTDQFNFGVWQQAFESCGLDMAFFTTRRRDLAEPLPWAHIQSGVAQDFLYEQWHAAQKGQTVSDCRHGDCHQCGVCDFAALEPRTYPNQTVLASMQQEAGETTEGPYHQLELTYSKLDQARFFGHLEQANIISRALRRGSIKVQFSSGYHPMPRLSFDNPIPLGMESEAEKFRVTVSSKIACAELQDALNRNLPAGLRITDCQPYAKNAAQLKKQGERIDRYRAYPDQLFFPCEKAMEAFKQAQEWPYTCLKSKNRILTIDLKNWVRTILWEETQSLYLEILSFEGQMIRPADVLISVFGIDSVTAHRVRARKLIGLA